MAPISKTKNKICAGATAGLSSSVAERRLFTSTGGQAAPGTRRHPPRRGSLYIMVLFVSMMVSMMGLAAIHLSRLTVREATGSYNRHEAALLGASAVENGLNVIAGDPNWRTNLAHDTEYPATPVSLGSGTFTWKLIDDDGNLADDPVDTVLLQGIGRLGDKTYVEQVRLQPTETGLTCLEASLHSGGTIDTGWGDDITTNQMISSNGNIDAQSNNSTITGDAWAVGTIVGDVTGTTYASQSPPKEMPGSSALDYYINMGTTIDITALPFSFGSYRLEKLVLSPQSNPFGTPNAEGIYVIDCAGSGIKVRNLRVQGTLVLLDPAWGSAVDEEVLFEPAVSNFPTLLVRGDLYLAHNQNLLDETAEGVNFNPVGTPYEGSEDGDTSDTYPSVVRGLVYMSGKHDRAFITSTVEGVIVSATMDANASLNLTYSSIFLNSPPPGFASGSEMQIIPGSWTRVVSP